MAEDLTALEKRVGKLESQMKLLLEALETMYKITKTAEVVELLRTIEKLKET